MTANQTSFKKGNPLAAKGGRSHGGKQTLSASIKQMIRDKVDWDEIISTLMKLAKGGYKMENYHGDRITAAPDKEAIRILLEYGFGRPIQQVEGSEEMTSALQAFTEFAQEFALPRKSPVQASESVTVEAIGETPAQ